MDDFMQQALTQAKNKIVEQAMKLQYDANDAVQAKIEELYLDKEFTSAVASIYPERYFASNVRYEQFSLAMRNAVDALIVMLQQRVVLMINQLKEDDYLPEFAGANDQLIQDCNQGIQASLLSEDGILAIANIYYLAYIGALDFHSEIYLQNIRKKIAFANGIGRVWWYLQHNLQMLCICRCGLY